MNKTLLVTDDAVLIRTMIKNTAAENGWTIVAEADNGAAAIEQYKQHRPAVVTMDLVMPEYDGLYALRGIKEFDPDARIVVVSALNQQRLLKQAFTAGASDFICKPFQNEELLEALDKLYAGSASAAT